MISPLVKGLTPGARVMGGLPGSVHGIAVVVPTRNRSRQLLRLLESLERLEGLVPDEVIVVHSDAGDGTSGVLADWTSRPHAFTARAVPQPPGFGPGDARNIGLRQARSRIVAFTDDDCIVDARWLSELVPAVDADSGVVGAGGSVLPTTPDFISRYYAYYRILEPPDSLLYLVTANCAYDRRAALEAGGFDAAIPTPGGEDVALSIRLRRRGKRFSFAPRAMVRHEFRGDIPDFLRTFRNYGRGCRQAVESEMGRPAQ